MTTVGYGDFFLKSFPSRLIGIICSFYGVYLVSLFVVTLTNFLEFSSSEMTAYGLSERLLVKDSLKLEATRVIVA